MLVDLALIAIGLCIFWRVKQFIFRLVICVALVVTVGTTIVRHSLSHSSGDAPSAASHTRCQSLEVIGARGSRSNAADKNVSDRTLNSVVATLKKNAPDGLAVHFTPIRYPAIPVAETNLKYPANYGNSIQSGRETLSRTVSDSSSECLALIGYSQGADVVAGSVLDTYGDGLNSADLDRVVAVAIVGDPRFKGGQQFGINVGTFSTNNNGIWSSIGPKEKPREWPSRDASFVRSYCAKGDWMCNFSPNNAEGCLVHGKTCAHSRYATTNKVNGKTYTTLMAEWILSRV